MIPPREEGWLADDLDKLPDAPRHTELLDGALVFNMSPQRRWHARLIFRLTGALAEQAPADVEVEHEMTVRLDDRNRPEPDIVVTTSAPYDPDTTYFDAADVLLVVEVESPESKHRDRTVKLRKYAEAGIACYWRVGQEREGPVVTVYELDRGARQYVPTAIARGRLQTTRPFPIDIDLTSLA